MEMNIKTMETEEVAEDYLHVRHLIEEIEDINEYRGGLFLNEKFEDENQSNLINQDISLKEKICKRLMEAKVKKHAIIPKKMK